MPDNTQTRRRNARNAFVRAGFAAVVVVVLYTLLYLTEPFSPFVNSLASNIVIVGVAATSMTLAVLTSRRYDPADSPRAIWSQLAIGLGLWTVAELIWAAYNLTFGEVGFTIADLFWVLAYFFFIRALFIQYRLLFSPSRTQSFRWIVLWVVSILSLTVMIAWLLTRFTEEQWGLPLIVGAFYPAADFVIGLVALGIVHRFRGGALGLPWIGLLVFAFADLLYAVLDFTGTYSWSVTNANPLSTVADVTYIAAYLFIVLGCYAQLLLLRNGPFFVLYRAPKETS